MGVGDQWPIAKQPNQSNSEASTPQASFSHLEISTNEERLEEWTSKMTTVQQHIPSQRKDLRKQDRIDLVVDHYKEQSWGQFKADLLSIGCRLPDIDMVE